MDFLFCKQIYTKPALQGILDVNLPRNLAQMGCFTGEIYT